MKVIIAILVVACVVLGILLYKKDKTVEIKEVEVVKTVTQFSNDLGKASAKLEEQRQVNVQLTNLLDNTEQKVEELVGKSKRLEGDLTRVSSERDDYRRQAENIAKAAEEAAKIAQQEIERRTAQITDLEKENERLNKEMGALTNRIVELEAKIVDTQKLLASSHGERDFLLKELKRLQDEKAELQRQFNDLKIVKTQVKKLTEEHHVALRLEWSRKGLYDNWKGAELLQRGVPKNDSVISTTPNLDVEIRREGPATIRTITNSTPW